MESLDHEMNRRFGMTMVEYLQSSLIARRAFEITSDFYIQIGVRVPSRIFVNHMMRIVEQERSEDLPIEHQFFISTKTFIDR